MMNCQKRTIYCVILADNGVPLAWGRNQCDPPEVTDHMGTFPTCSRMYKKEPEQGYIGEGCNSVHAEIAAVNMLKANGIHKMHVDTAIVVGHDFCCYPCLQALFAAGVREVNVLRDDGTACPYMP